VVLSRQFFGQLFEQSTGANGNERWKFLQDSFNCCTPIIRGLTDQQLSAKHNSPDGKLRGREVLLALYIHVAHHRGQAEIYPRDKGIKPPSYRI